MAEGRFDPHQLLKVFAIMSQQGERTAAGYALLGLEALSSEDGYTLEFNDQHVRLQLLFHNKYHVDFEREEHLTQFQARLDRIIALDV